MFTIQDRNLFGKWEAVPGKMFVTLQAARGWCIEMSDHLNIAYRVIDESGAVVDVIDLEADFWALGPHDKPGE